MGIFSNQAEAELNVQNVKRVPRELPDDKTYNSLIGRARRGEDVFTYSSGQRTNWNLWIAGRRVWLNDPSGPGGAA